jgi:hypothetical protein
MSVTNDELIEELLWKAYEKGFGIELLEAAKVYMDRDGIRKSFAYQKAYIELDAQH